MRGSFLAILTSLLLCAPAKLHAQIDSPDDFKPKVVAVWKSLLEKIRSARWEEKIEYFGSAAINNPKLSRIDIIKGAFVRNAGVLWSTQVDYLDGTTKVKKHLENEQISIMNLKYSADLGKKKGNSGWVVRELKTGNDKKGATHGWEFRFPWMTIGVTELYTAFQSSTFLVTKIENLPQSTGAIVRAYFVFDGPLHACLLPTSLEDNRSDPRIPVKTKGWSVRPSG